MITYRIYSLDLQGQIVSRSEADCDNDADAYARARATLEADGEAEVWVGRRLVGRVRHW
jgi:hypothetical protein